MEYLLSSILYHFMEYANWKHGKSFFRKKKKAVERVLCALMGVCDFNNSI